MDCLQPAATSLVSGGAKHSLLHISARFRFIYTTYSVGWYSYSTQQAFCQGDTEKNFRFFEKTGPHQSSVRTG